MPRTIYTGLGGKMRRVCEPVGPQDRANFVITYKDKDWSGFRTLAECEAQFPELESKHVIDDFAVVEK